VCNFCEHSVAKWERSKAFVFGIFKKAKNEFFSGFFLEFSLEGQRRQNSRALSRLL
jgi:hypothetical protein